LRDDVSTDGQPVDAWPEDFLKCIGAWSGELPRPKRDLDLPLRDPFAV